LNNLYTGIFSSNSNPTIKNCIIAKNSQSGININSIFNYKDTIIIQNNTIVDNRSTGFTCWNATSKLSNNIFWGNQQTFYVANNRAYLYNNLFPEETFSNWALTMKTGNIFNFNPQFVDAKNQNYHLRATSPCIDSGDPTSIFTNEPSDNGGRINMGSYGNTNEATTSEYFPTITYLSIRKGRMFGSDTLIIKGRNFLSTRGNGKVTFFATEAKKYLIWNSDSIVCITPSHNTGAFDVYILNNNNKKGFGVKSFTFSPPLINQVKPVYTNIAGNSTITFTGKLFGRNQSGAKLLFEDLESKSYSKWNDTIVVVSCPTHSKGLVDLVFSIDDTVKYSYKNSFLYTDEAIQELCGTIPDTLKRSKTYLITCSITIPKTQKLLIEPGVVIMIQHSPDNEIFIKADGVISAIGKENEPINFISIPQYGGYWKGLILNNNADFSYCSIQDAQNGILHNDGKLIITNSEFSANSITGLKLNGDESYINAKIQNTLFKGNSLGLYAYADCNNSSGDVDLTIVGSTFTENSEGAISMYSTGSTSGYRVSYSESSSINLKLQNSIISDNGGNAIKLESFGYIDDDYIPNAHRYGHVNLTSENSLIFKNEKGIYVNRRNITNCSAYLKLYNTNFYKNNSTIDMNADKVFVYNSNLWDNNVSSSFTGDCDSLIVKNSNLNSLNNLPLSDNNISTNPMFVSADNSDFHLMPNSPFIDNGVNEFALAATDYDGKARILDGDGNSVSTVDIGAFESGIATLTVTPISRTVEASSGSTNFAVTANYIWTVTEDEDWLTATKTNASTLSVNYNQNLGTNQRTATINIPGVVSGLHNISLIQNGASPYITITPSSKTVSSGAGTSTFLVSSNVVWTATENSDWITVVKTNATTLSVTYSGNTNGVSRSESITISGPGATNQTVTLIQNNATPTLSVSPTSKTVSATKGTATFTVASNIDWILNENCDWLSAVKTNSTTLTITYDSNISVNSRTANITLSGTGVTSKNISFIQNGATPYINTTPAFRDVSSEFGTTSISIDSNISWSISENASWIVTSKTDANTLAINYDENTAANSRSAIITISGSGVTSKTVTINQNGAGLKLEVSPNSKTVNSSSGTIVLNVDSNIDWQFNKTAIWFSVVKTDASTATVTYDENINTSTRSADITFTGNGVTSKTITLNQNGAGTYLQIAPILKNVNTTSGTTTFEVNSNIDWSLSEDAEWLTAIKTDAATITVHYDENIAINSRSANIKVEGTGIVTQIIVVTQEGNAPILNVSPLDTIVSSEAGIIIYSVSSNTNWEIDESIDWIKTEKTNETTFTVALTKNTDQQDRTASITVKAGQTSSKTLKITQKSSLPNEILDLTRSGIIVYPVPTKGKLFFKFASLHKSDIIISINDVIGNEVYIKRYTSVDEIESIDISSLGSGVYLVVVNSPNYKEIFRILKE